MGEENLVDELPVNFGDNPKGFDYKAIIGSLPEDNKEEDSIIGEFLTLACVPLRNVPCLSASSSSSSSSLELSLFHPFDIALNLIHLRHLIGE
ncbi:hypothetical protein K2173_009057 [Erythroxylum novogranatense]|uniref:Uncharacterized protein n=1 Tax=Erythroxylum novogranatense TaxID=1862640 RepID=A0AAV8TSP5_9ROSI|nr:hypothetical protein K2173_009057 [Erythroxylum novogranatense]